MIRIKVLIYINYNSCGLLKWAAPRTEERKCDEDDSVRFIEGVRTLAWLCNKKVSFNLNEMNSTTVYNIIENL